jgi:hypothetical protein
MSDALAEHLADALKREQRAAGRKAKTPTKRNTEPQYRARAPPFDGPLPLLATVARAAFELMISPRQVYYLVDQGALEMVHVSARASRITRDSILALAAKRTAPRPVKNFAKDAR